MTPWPRQTRFWTPRHALLAYLLLLLAACAPATEAPPRARYVATPAEMLDAIEAVASELRPAGFTETYEVRRRGETSITLRARERGTSPAFGEQTSEISFQLFQDASVVSVEASGRGRGVPAVLDSIFSELDRRFRRVADSP